MFNCSYCWQSLKFWTEMRLVPLTIAKLEPADSTNVVVYLCFRLDGREFGDTFLAGVENYFSTPSTVALVSMRLSIQAWPLNPRVNCQGVKVTTVLSLEPRLRMCVALPPLLHTSRLEKAYRGSGGIAPLNLNLGARWRWVDTVTPRSFSPGGGKNFGTHRRGGGGGGRAGLKVSEKRKNFLLHGLEPPTIQSVA